MSVRSRIMENDPHVQMEKKVKEKKQKKTD